MIAIRFERKGGAIRFFESKGHAGFAEEGMDIVCAAVSVLSINTANSLEQLTEDTFQVEEKDGFLSIRFSEEPSKEASLLMESLLLGLTSIEKSYGRKYLKVSIREVS